MVTYWTMFVLPLLAGLSPFRMDRQTKGFLYALVFLTLTLIIGGRDVVGCDWNSYLGHYYNAGTRTFMDALEQGYPGYSLLNWLAVQMGLSIHAVNTACAAIFTFGLLAFCRRQPRPWLILLTAMPYLVTVVSMGFTRQATALGFLMLAFNAFTSRKLILFLALVGAAGLFHSSAVALAPMAVMIRRDRAFSPLVIGAAASAMLVMAILSNSLDRYVYAYVESEYEGEGALYRLPLNALAGVAVLLFRKRWLAKFDDGRFYVIMAIASIVILPLAFYLPVMADRMGMYLLPFQVAVAARLPDLVRPNYRVITMIGVVLLYAVSLYVWLNYANHASCWLPYSSAYF